MKKLGLAACAGLLMALPAAAHAQTDDAHPQGADQGQHDHSAPAASDEGADPSAMQQRQMEEGAHMENCRCPCCEMMKQHGGGMGKPSDDETADAPPEQSEDHQH